MVQGDRLEWSPYTDFLKEVVGVLRALKALSTIMALLILLPGVTWASELRVVATIYPLASIVRAVGGERVDVECLVPPGASPHGFELKPSQIRAIKRASLLVKVGAHLDDWLDRALNGAGCKVFVVTKGLELDEGNPHVWLDPVMVEERVPGLVAVLSELDPSGAPYYRKRGKAFRLELERLTARIRELLGPMPCRYYVAQHGAWHYFCQRFGLFTLGVVEEVPGREPGPMKFMALLRTIKEHGRVLLIANRGENPRVMEVLARDGGGHLVRLDPLGDPNDPQRRDLVSLLIYNARRMLNACYGY